MSEDDDSRRTLKLKAEAAKPPVDPRAPRRPPVRPRGPARARPLSESPRPDLPVQPAATASAPGLPEGAPRPTGPRPPRDDFASRGAARPAGPRSRDERPAGPRAPGGWSKPPRARDERDERPRGPGGWGDGPRSRERDERAPAPRAPGQWSKPARPRDERAPAPRPTGAWSDAPRERDERGPAPRRAGGGNEGPRGPGGWGEGPRSRERDERAPAPRAPGQWSKPTRPRDERAPAPRSTGGWSDAPRERDDRGPAPRRAGGWNEGPRERDERGPAPRRPGAWGDAPRGRDDRAPAPRAPGQWTKPSRPRDDRQPPRGAGPRDFGAPRSAPPRSPARPAPAPAPRAPAFPPGTPREGVRLNKRLSEMGLCSRREGDEWIEKGWVLVNGAVAVMGQPVTESDQIELLPQAQRSQEERVTILLHKPVGYVSGQAEDGHETAAVLFNARTRWHEDPSERRFSPGQHKGLAPAGRLDIDSTGLLVLTQDGRVARQLIGEDSEVDKEYLVRVHWAPNGPQGEGLVTQDVQAVFPEDRLALLRHGLSLDDQPLKPAQVEWLNPEQLRFVLVEGKKRQIRRMCEAVGLHVVGLKRVRIGRVQLGQLPQGQWRYLDENEVF